jgi:molybdenum cofactor cytidylyltransferase
MSRKIEGPERRAWAVAILAAGVAQRMGQPKQLMAVDGQLLILRAIDIAQAGGPDQIIVVTGAYGEEVARVIQAHSQAGQVQVVHNPDYAMGQATSMQAGLRAVADHCGAALFLPVDQPFVPPELLRAMVQAWREGAPLATPVVEGKPRGAPALFDRALWPDLYAVQGDVGGRPVVQRYRHLAARVPAEPGWLVDVDTPEDVARLRGGADDKVTG